MNRWPLSLAFLIVLTSIAQAQNESQKGLIQVAETSNRSDALISSATAIAPVSPSHPGSTPPQSTPTMGVRASKEDTEENRVFEFDKRPHLIFLPSLRLNGAGFAPVSVALGGGLSFEPKHLILEATATYNTARKTNDGTIDNRKGHIRSADATAFYRLSNCWFFGATGGWSQLSTTNYMKESRGMGFGGGKDFMVHDTSMRLHITYTPPNFDHANGSQGFNITLHLPSPLVQRRFSFYEQIGIKMFHDTITDPQDPITTAQEMANRHTAASVIFGVRIRIEPTAALGRLAKITFR